jgi:DNA recombination protein RmuC
MSDSHLILLLLVFCAFISLIGLIVLWLRKPDAGASQSLRQELTAAIFQGNERLERELRRELVETARDARQEQAQALGAFQSGLVQHGAESARIQTQQLQGVQTVLAQMQKQVSDTLAQQLDALSEANARRLTEMRGTLQEQMAQLQQSNSAKLDEMRQTVDEKLQSTLQTRLDNSFKQVAERLEMVHRGLGEMQTLAQGVGDLKHLLTNVKVRGIFGEAQLGALLEQVFTPDQYAAQVQVHPASRHAVDFAIRLPGKGEDGGPMWLPIDAKFPNEDYERLLTAQQRADAPAAEQAARQLEARIRLEAKNISDRYLAPPYTTDFAILFLPTEGLYAEVLRRPGLMEGVQREFRIALAGPTTLLVMLNALQMGFRTLALEQRSSEVWQVLGAVKTEFGKFADVLGKIRSQTQTVLRTLDNADVRNRAMQRALRSAEALPDTQAQGILGTDGDAPQETSAD